MQTLCIECGFCSASLQDQIHFVNQTKRAWWFQKSESAGHWDHIPTGKSYVKSVFWLRTSQDHFSAAFSHTFLFRSARQAVSRDKAPVRISSSSWTEVWSAQTWTLGTLFTHIIVTCKPPCRKHKIHLYILHLQAMTAQTEQAQKTTERRKKKRKETQVWSRFLQSKAKVSGQSLQQLPHLQVLCVTGGKRRKLDLLQVFSCPQWK